jgi:hypothetical protein
MTRGAPEKIASPRLHSPHASFLTGARLKVEARMSIFE